MFETAPEGVVIVDAKGQVRQANKEFCRMFGYTLQEVLGQSLNTLIAAGELLVEATDLSNQVKPGERLSVETVRRRKDGNLIDVSILVSGIEDGGHQPSFCAVYRDITERKHIEQGIIDNPSSFRALADAIPVSVYIHDGHRCLFANRATAAIDHTTPEQVRARTGEDAVHPDDVPILREREARRHRGEPIPSRYELRIRRRNGEVRWIEASDASVQFQGVNATLSAGFDITERKHAQEALIESEAKFRAIADAATTAIFMLSEDRLLYVNRACELISGQSSAELTSMPLLGNVHSEDVQALRATISNLFRDEKAPNRLDFRVITHASEARWIEATAAIIQFQGQKALVASGQDVTEARHTRQALVESEAKFRAIADAATAGILILTDRRILFANHACELMSGFDQDELLSLDPLSIIHPEYIDLVRETIHQLQIGHDIPNRLEYKLIRKDGEERWIESSAALIRFEGHDALLVTGFDITERKQSQQLQSALYSISECANTAQDLQTLFAAIHSIVAELLYARNFNIALLDEETGLLSWPYFVDERVDDPPPARPLNRGLTEYVLRSGEPLLASPEVYKVLLASGAVELHGNAPIDWLGVPLKRGNRCFGVLTLKSYTESVRFQQHELELLNFVGQHVASAIVHKQDHEAIRLSEARYRSLFERAVYGICRAAVDGRILDANPVLATMLGYDSPAELLRLNLGSDVYVDPAERQRIHACAEEARHVQETRWKRKDGKIIDVRLNGAFITDSSGELQGYELLVENLTEQRALEEQLRHSQKMDAVGRLAGGVAHDFNNLLTVIKGYTDLLIERVPTQDSAHGQLEEIRKAADRAANLTSQLLAFSRRQVMTPRVLDLNQVVSNMEKMLHRLLGEDIELLIELKPNPGNIKADPGQIEQVLMNLAVNARDAMPKGGQLLIETSEVKLDESCNFGSAALVPGDYVLLAVSDNGSGMDEETRLHAFEPFFTTRERGTGLGLATVYGIVKQSGGYVWIYSELGEGTTVKVYLPRVAQQAKVAQNKPDQQTMRGTETILLVEDEDGVRNLVQEMLQAFGYTALQAANGRDALALCQNYPGPIHLLLTDVVLRQMSGAELAAQLTAVRPGMRVLYMSGYTEDTIVNHGVLRSGISFLQKPFTTRTIARTIREVLDKNLD